MREIIIFVLFVVVFVYMVKKRNSYEFIKSKFIKTLIYEKIYELTKEENFITFNEIWVDVSKIYIEYECREEGGNKIYSKDWYYSNYDCLHPNISDDNRRDIMAKTIMELVSDSYELGSSEFKWLGYYKRRLP